MYIVSTHKRRFWGLVVVLAGSACTDTEMAHGGTVDAGGAVQPSASHDASVGVMQSGKSPPMSLGHFMLDTTGERVNFAQATLRINELEDGKAAAELLVGAQTTGASVSQINVSVYVPAANGALSMVGAHPVLESGPLGLQTSVSVTLDGVEYIAERGEVVVTSHDAGKIRGTFATEMAEVRPSGGSVKQLKGSFEGSVQLVCLARRSASGSEPTGGSQAGASQASGEAMSLDSPFCRPFTR